MSEAARIDLVDRAPLTEKQQNVYESIMQYQRVNGLLFSILNDASFFRLNNTVFAGL